MPQSEPLPRRVQRGSISGGLAGGLPVSPDLGHGHQSLVASGDVASVELHCQPHPEDVQDWSLERGSVWPEVLENWGQTRPRSNVPGRSPARRFPGADPLTFCALAPSLTSHTQWECGQTCPSRCPVQGKPSRLEGGEEGVREHPAQSTHAPPPEKPPADMWVGQGHRPQWGRGSATGRGCPRPRECAGDGSGPRGRASWHTHRACPEGLGGPREAPTLQGLSWPSEGTLSTCDSAPLHQSAGPPSTSSPGLSWGRNGAGEPVGPLKRRQHLTSKRAGAQKSPACAVCPGKAASVPARPPTVPAYPEPWARPGAGG